MLCTKCGNQIGDNAKFCVHCGEPVVRPAVEEPAPVVDPEPAPAVEEHIPVEETAPVYQEPVPAPMPKPEPKYEPPKENKPLYDPDEIYRSEEPAPAPVKTEKPLSVWGYLWRMFLFAIPVLGLIPMFVLAFADGINKNSRNFSRAVLICLLILFVIAIAGGVALLWMIRDPELIKQYFKSIFDTVTTFPAGK